MGKRQPNFKVGDLVGRRSIKSRIGIVTHLGPYRYYVDSPAGEYGVEGYPQQIYWFDIGVAREVTAHTYRDIYIIELPK